MCEGKVRNAANAAVYIQFVAASRPTQSVFNSPPKNTRAYILGVTLAEAAWTAKN